MKTRVIWVTVAAACVGLGIWAVERPSGGAVGPVAATSGSIAARPEGSAAPSVPVAKGFRDMWLLKPPAGAKVAVWEFDDLECPGCAHALPLVHAAAEQYKVPLVHRDFPLTEIHVWSFDAAVAARYLQDRVSPALADVFRKDVFANQTMIASKDDLARFTARWFEAHHEALPFVIDPSGACENEVKADRALGDRIGVKEHGTPCIFVVTQQHWALVTDVTQIGRMIEAAMAERAANATPIDDPKRQV